MRKLIPTLSTCVVLATSLALPPPAHAVVSQTLRKQAYFNNPGGGNYGDPASGPSPLADQVVNLINSAATGSTIRIAIYFLGDDSVADRDEVEPNRIVSALRAAVSRGANVKIVVDDDYADTPTNQFIPTIDAFDGGGDSGPVAITYCTNGCYNSVVPSGKMHDKLLLIDDVTWTTAREKVVAISSANWSDKQLRTHYHNDMTVIWGDGPLYDGLQQYWGDLWNCGNGGEAGCASSYPMQSVSGSSRASVQISPQSVGDPQMTQLQNVGCVDWTFIRVAMGSWSGTRGEAIADELKRKKDQGCQVRILVPEGEPILPTLRQNQLHFRCLGDGTLNDGDHPGPGVHNKQVLVDGYYSGVRSRIVFTGSTNFTYNALGVNDEVWLKVTDDANAPVENDILYSAYEQRWLHMYDQSFAC